MSPQSPPSADPPARKRWWSSAWIWIVLPAAILIPTAIVLAYFFFTAPIPDRLPDTTGMSAEAAARQDATAEMEIARLHAEARRNTLALGAGLAALAALALAVRRQYHHEKTTVKAQNDERRRQDHLEEDALQRRITDSRIRAVEQLGSDNPAVRIGGLHNLERIGQLHHELRQVVLDEICSYLRQPYTPPPPEKEPKKRLPNRQFEPLGPPPAETASDEVEGEVRLIAQEILQRHLHPDSGVLYWEHSRLNLRNARLDNVDFSGCRLTQADFTNGTLTGDAHFTNATLTGIANFTNAAFTGYANFANVAFTGDAGFGGATFTGHAGFGGATFINNSFFEGADFTRDAYFRDATFTGDAYFRDAAFTGNVSFEGVTFAGTANFRDAMFTNTVYFRGATFTNHANFRDAMFTNTVYFRGATFTNPANFRNVTVDGFMEFEHARFQSALRTTSPALLAALQGRSIRLRMEFGYLLPVDWGLEPDPTEPEWGHLINQAAKSQA